KEGLNVVGLEKGQERNTEDYYMVHDELRYAIRGELFQDLSKETLTFRSNDGMRALPMRHYGSSLLGSGLGGAGVHWNGQTYRFLPFDFEIRSKTIDRYGKDNIPDDMRIHDCRITYDQMQPYDYQYEKMAGIAGEENHLGGKRSDKYPTPPMLHSQQMKMFKKATEKLNYHPYTIPSANLSEPYENPDGISRAACEYCAFCERFGCE